MRIVLENLLQNAWKFARQHPHPVISFGMLSEADRAVFFVQENGAGFDMVHAVRLFSPFQRLHPDEQFEGTGIGLATAQRIVHRREGIIWAESEPGSGTMIFFTLEAPLALRLLPIG